jgi:ABC-type multidrug transport system fused ATPase/permease subunit
MRTQQTRMTEWVWLFLVTRREWTRIIAGSSLTAIGAALALCDPLLMKTLLDTALPRRDLRLAMALVGLTAAALLARPYFAGAGLVITYRAFLDAAHDLRISLLEHITRLSIDYHEQTPLGDKLSRIEHDVTAIGDFGSDVLSGTLRALVLLALNCGAVVSISPIVGLFVMIAIPGFVIVERTLTRRLQRSANEVQTETGSSTACLCEFLSFVPDLQLLVAEFFGSKRVIAFWRARRNAQQRLKKAEAIFGAATGSVITWALMATLAVGSIEVTKGRLTIGGLVAIFAFASRLFDPVGAAMELYSHIQRMRVSVARVRVAFGLKPAIADRGTVRLDSVRAPDLRVANIYYGYSSARTVLRDVSVNVGSGQRIVIAGKSGSGKSTLARLLVRFGDPSRGEILLAGRRLAEYPLAELRRAVTYVPQRPAVFSGTIAENLRYGNDRACDQELRQIIETVELEQLVFNTGDGLNTLLGAGGVSLSGGEAQRLILARALLRNSHVLVLDESTSALDLPTERTILRNILRSRPGMTLIVISHRLPSVAAWADKIVVLEDGVVLAEGPHNVLYRAVPAYRKLFDSSDLTGAEFERPMAYSANGETAPQFDTLCQLRQNAPCRGSQQPAAPEPAAWQTTANQCER